MNLLALALLLAPADETLVLRDALIVSHGTVPPYSGVLWTMTELRVQRPDGGTLTMYRTHLEDGDVPAPGSRCDIQYGTGKLGELIGTHQGVMAVPGPGLVIREMSCRRTWPEASPTPAYAGE